MNKKMKEMMDKKAKAKPKPMGKAPTKKGKK